MEIDVSAVRQFLTYVDGDVPLSAVWDHPAYELARDHAELLGRELTRDDVVGALDGEQTLFSNVADLGPNRDRITELMTTVESNETAWREQIERELERVTPDEDLSDVTVFLGIGYSLGIGLADGAYVNVNEPLYFEQPRQLLYTAIHESSHVVYEQVHGAVSEVTPDQFRSREGQQYVFDTVFQTEAYATYTPLALRRADGNVGAHDHVLCNDYSACTDDAHVTELVEEYDSVRETLREGQVSRETFLSFLFGGERIPYRVGCALVERLAEVEGMDAVREGFHTNSAEFTERYDWVLDEYRSDR